VWADAGGTRLVNLLETALSILGTARAARADVTAMGLLGLAAAPAALGAHLKDKEKLIADS